MWLSLTPKPPHIHQSLLGWDKFQHAMAYGLFTALAGTAFKSAPQSPLGRHPWRWAFLIALLFGALMEIMQEMMALGRTGEFADLLADGCGAAIVYLFVSYQEQSRRKKGTHN